MTTIVVLHDVDDVDHWLSSSKREELFGPLGITARTFRGAEGSNSVGLIVQTPDIATWEQALQTDAAADAMKHDGVRPDTIVLLTEG
jgi:hypothetical protein